MARVVTTCFLFVVLAGANLHTGSGPDTKGFACAAEDYGVQAIPGLAEDETTGSGTPTSSFPTSTLAVSGLKPALERLGAADTASCMPNVRRILVTSAPSSPALTSLCVAGQQLLDGVQSFKTQCPAGQLKLQDERRNGSFHETDSSRLVDVLLANLTDGLQVATGKMEKCCKIMNRNTSSSSVSMCLIIARLAVDLQTLHNLLLALSESIEAGNMSVPSCREQFSTLDRQFQQMKSNINLISALSASSQVQNFLLSVRQLDGLTTLLLNGRSSANSLLATSPHVALLLCASLFPVCVNGNTLPPCRPACEKTNTVIHSFRPFLNFKSIPILDLLDEAVTSCFIQTASTTRCLQESAPAYTIVNTSDLGQVAALASEEEDSGGFCLNTECRSPLRWTSDESHWDKDIQSALVSIYAAMSAIFPNGTLPLNRSILSCGRDCVTIGFTDYEHRVAQIMLTVFSCISTASVIFAFVVFYFNRRELGRHFLRRVTMMFLGCACIAQIPYVFSAKGAGFDSILCYSDGTLITDLSSSDIRCWWTAVQAHLFATMGAGYTTVLTYSWQWLALALSQPGPGERLQARSQGIRKGGYILRGVWGSSQKNFKFKVANTPNFNDFLQLPKKFRMSKYLLLLTEMPDLLQAAFRETVFNALNI